jgi:hypothetical protein
MPNTKAAEKDCTVPVGDGSRRRSGSGKKARPMLMAVLLVSSSSPLGVIDAVPVEGEAGVGEAGVDELAMVVVSGGEWCGANGNAY